MSVYRRMWGKKPNKWKTLMKSGLISKWDGCGMYRNCFWFVVTQASYIREGAGL